MKRIFCLLLFCTSALAGQADTAVMTKRLEVGLGFGMMDHTVDFTPNVNDAAVRRNNFGLTFRYFDHSLVGFQAELSYVQAGWQEEIDETFATPYLRETEYAELLILTQFSVGRGAFQPMLQAGPYLSVPLGEQETLPAGFTPVESNPPPYYGNELPFRINYGVQAGLGFNLEIGPITLQAEGRYLLGFNDLIRTGETTASVSRRAGIGGRVAVFYALINSEKN